MGNNRAKGARESRTRAAAKHSEAPHPRRGNGGATGCYGDDNGESRSEAETSVQSARWQRVEQPEQPEHSHRDADHGEHDHLLLLVVQLRAPPDANWVDALLREPAANEQERGASRAWKSEHRRTFGISVMCSHNFS